MIALACLWERAGLRTAARVSAATLSILEAMILLILTVRILFLGRRTLPLRPLAFHLIGQLGPDGTRLPLSRHSTSL